MATGGFFQTARKARSCSSQTRGLEKQVCVRRALLRPVALMQTVVRLQKVAGPDEEAKDVRVFMLSQPQAIKHGPQKHFREKTHSPAGE